MATMADIRNGMVIDLKGELWEVIEFLHVKPGKGPAFMRSKLKNLRSDKIVDYTFRDSDNFDEVRVERTRKEYLYRDGGFFVLMDLENYEQMNVEAATIGEKELLMRENMEVTIAMTPDGEILDVELPTTVIMSIAECEPNVKGNTASGGSAFTESGLRIRAFSLKRAINQIDTRTRVYIERA